MEEAPPLSAERLVQAYQRLASVAEDLGEATKKFTKPVADIESLLQKLNLGMTAWEPFSSNEASDGSWSRRDIGYAKVNRKWGLAIREWKGWNQSPEEDTVEEWPFHDAPRSYRIEAFDSIPALLERLSSVSQKTATKLREKALEAGDIADALVHAHRASETAKKADLDGALRDAEKALKLGRDAAHGRTAARLPIKPRGSGGR